MAHYPADTFQEATEIAIEASNQLHGVINGDANAEVTVEDGSTIPSIRKAQTDSMYFKEPEAWTSGQTETDYLQLKKYIDPTTNKESWWFAKGALVSNPIAMGTSPFGDDNWTLYTPEDLFISGKAEYESVYQALKGKAAEAGYNLVAGSFEEGGTLTNTNDVLWYQSNGKYYNWYDGSAKTVAAGATPATSGGISSTAWVDRTDLTLRSEINVVVKRYASVSDMVNDTSLIIGQRVAFDSYYAGIDKGGNEGVVVAAATGTHDGGSYIDLTASGLQFKGLFLDGVDVCQFGARGDGVTDDISSIQSAVDFVYSSGNKGAVLFPTGVFMITSPIVLNQSNISLIGTGRQGTTSLTPLEYASSMILAKFESSGSNNAAIIVHSGSTSIVHKVDIEKIRIGAASGLSSKPYGIRYSQFSEGYLDSIDFNSGLLAGILFDGVTIVYASRIQTGGNDYSVEFNRTSSGTFTSSSSIFFSYCNFWLASEYHLIVRDSSVHVKISDSWLESAKSTVMYSPDITKISGIMELSLDGVRVNGLIPNSNVISSLLPANSSSYTSDIYIRGCHFNIEGTAPINYVISPNTGTSYIRRASIHDSNFYGVNQTSVVYSDTQNSSAFFNGKISASTSYSSEGQIVPFGGGSTKICAIVNAFPYLDMSKGMPLKLPQLDAFSYSNSGQIFFDSVRDRVVYTSTGTKIYVPRPKIQYVSDANVSIDVQSSAETIIFSSPITVNRTVTVSTVNIYNGAKFRIVRSASSTGAFNVAVGSYKTLTSPGQWCEIESDGGGWVLTAYGTL